MAKVKLPSGKVVKVPDEMSKNQTIEFLFEKLEGKEGYEEDRKKLGDQLETSGWGSVIGGGLGALDQLPYPVVAVPKHRQPLT